MDFRQSLGAYQQQLAELSAMEARFEAERRVRLAALPGEFGYSDVAAFIHALREAAAATSPKPARVARLRSAEAPPTVRLPAVSVAAAVSAPGIGLARSAQQQAAASTHPVVGARVAEGAVSMPVPASAPSAPSAAPKNDALRLPTGTSLDDPATFGQMPEFALLERGALDVGTHRSRMAEALRFATKVLHTSKVPAAVWREWRQFERLLMDAIRAAG